MTYAVVRVRGTSNVHPRIRDTLEMLNLTRANHGTLVRATDSTRGMLQAAKDFVTWGRVDAATVERLLAERGRLEGDTPLTDDHVAETTDFGSIADLAEAIAAGEATLKDVPRLKRVLRLPPPRGGYEGVKRAWRTGGALGDRGRDIQDLLDRMLQSARPAEGADTGTGSGTAEAQEASA